MSLNTVIGNTNITPPETRKVTIQLTMALLAVSKRRSLAVIILSWRTLRWLSGITKYSKVKVESLSRTQGTILKLQIRRQSLISTLWLGTMLLFLGGLEVQ